MEDTPARPTIYGYRWVVLLVYALLMLITQLQWLTFAAVASEAQVAYSATKIEIDLLSLIFMLVFIVMSLPASYVISRWGVRVGVGIGAALTAIFGLLKGVAADSYALVVVGQVGLAVAQPFVINAVTRVAASWFPIHERATAVGLATLAQFMGIIVVMILSPMLVTTDSAGVPELGGMLTIYGIVSAVVAVGTLVFLRERPPTPPQADAEEERLLSWSALRHMLAQRDMRLVLGLFFLGLGVFNATSTCVDQLCEVQHLSADDTGLVGGVMLIGGVIGAAIIPMLSDKKRKRRPFLILAMLLTTPALVGMSLTVGFVPLVAASTVLGIFLLGGGAPVGFQYAAEVSFPAAEAVSQGVIMLVGQVSGVLFILAIDAIGIMPMMYVFAGLGVLMVLIAVMMRESPRILTGDASAAPRD
ncbi:MAG: MFS transporter [Deltaproteobacteria bacterium]|nr:MAG: MFS transporter [Deltaproteobacteria bacterium]